VALISFLIPTVFRRGKTTSLPPGAPRNYGIIGGTICPKCGRPFGMHIWGLNMLVGKLDRCPYCGKWSLVRYVGREALREAEAAELEAPKEAPSIPSAGEEENLKKELDNSRYIDG
jgi:DNA-directed RNA polymerase subunit RPC12/RpoP